MGSGYAVVLGEALVDLVEAECDGEPVYRPMVGGAPLNVAVGLARLGVRAELLTALGSDVLGRRIRTFLAEAGVATTSCVESDGPTTLAVTSLHGGEPEFHFYGEPPSYARFGPDTLNLDTVRGASALYCGSIALLCPEPLAAARAAWAEPGPLRAFDPNVRPALLRDRAGLRSVVEGFAATANLVKLSEPDARELFDLGPDGASDHLRALGAAAVVVTRGARGALLAVGDERLAVPAPPVRASDTTGAGDAAMAGLIAGLVEYGVPDDLAGWRDRVIMANQVAGLCCERPGGATAMPTRADLTARFPPPSPR